MLRGWNKQALLFEMYKFFGNKIININIFVYEKTFEQTHLKIKVIISAFLILKIHLYNQSFQIFH